MNIFKLITLLAMCKNSSSQPQPVVLTRIEAVFNYNDYINSTSSLNSLKQYLTVTAYYSDSSSQVVNDYMLSGTLVAGTSTITVSYSNKTTTFDVQVFSYIGHIDLSDLNTTFATGGARTHETYNLSVMNNKKGTRLVFGYKTGVRKYRDYETGTILSIYPIPIPEKAGKAIISVIKKTSYNYNIVTDLQTRTYDGQLYSAAIDATGWIDANNYELTLTPGVEYLVISLRGNNSSNVESSLVQNNIQAISIDFISYG